MASDTPPIHRLQAALALLGVPEERVTRLIEAVEAGLRMSAIEQVLLQLASKDVQELQQVVASGPSEAQLLTWLRGRIPKLDALMREHVSHQVNGIVGLLDSFDALDSSTCEEYLKSLENGEFVLFD